MARAKLFGRTNPNDVLFNVELQEGSSILEGDEGVASIGDATMEHIQGMNSLQRLAYDAFIHMGDGNIFRLVDNPNWTDNDEHNLRHKTHEERLWKLARVSEGKRKEIEEAMQRLEEEESSEDVLKHPEVLIGYDDWEKYGGLSKYWDIPATPKPKSVWAGNSRQIFYDDFPDGHPLSNEISRVLITLDQYPWHTIMTQEQIDQHNKESRSKIVLTESGPKYVYTDGLIQYMNATAYVDSVRRMVVMARGFDGLKPLTFITLKELILKIASGTAGEPADLARNALHTLDQQLKETYLKEVFQKTKAEDPLYIYIVGLSKKFISMVKEGKEVYNDIKRYGQQLHEEGFLSERRVRKEDGSVVVEPTLLVMRNHHWAKYYQLKITVADLYMKQRRYSKAAEVYLSLLEEQKKDEASGTIVKRWKRCRVCGSSPDSKSSTKCDHTIYQKLLTAREMAKKNSSGNQENLKEYIGLIDTRKQEAVDKSDASIFTKLPSTLITAQKSGSVNLSKDDWSKVWAHYNANKAEVFKTLLSK